MLDIIDDNILRIKIITLQLLCMESVVFDMSEEKQYHVEP